MLEKPLFSVRSHEFCVRHMLVIAILVLSFTISMLMRGQPAEHGLHLNEFDPFFNYRATEFLLDNGIDAYGDWHDELSWYPDGRDISATSQFMQHATAAALYGVFGGGSDLRDFVVVLPIVLGALTGIVIFALVRVIAGTSAGLFASLLYAVSLPIILRGSIGWFKSEPIGLFYAALGLYLFVSGITCSRPKEAAIRLGGAGVIMALGLSAWGGVQFFIIPLGLFFMALPFLRSDHRFLLWAVPLFTVAFLAVTATFEHRGAGFVFGMGGLSLAISAAVMAGCIFLWRASGDHGARNSIILVLAAIGAAAVVLGANAYADYLELPGFRDIAAVNPLLSTTNVISESIAEHIPLTTVISFYFLSSFMIFGGLGVWFILSRRERIDSYGLPLRSDMIALAVILSFAGVYISSTFTRLVVFSSVAMAIVASIGLAILASLILSNRNARAGLKAGFVGTIVVILTVPLVVPEGVDWISASAEPYVILTGGSLSNVATNDWYDAMEWMRTQTPEDSLVMSWWDYGYWIETLGERTTLVDNLTVSSERIEQVGQIFFSDPDAAWTELDEIGVDYVVVFVSAHNVAPERGYYALGEGGDETKAIWIARIAGVDESDYFQSDSFTPTPEFEDTMLGEMFPFSHFRYVNIASGLQSVMWQPGFVSIVQKDVKLPADGEGPFRLAYSSPSFDEDVESIINGVFVYEVNPDYVPVVPEPEYDIEALTPFIYN